MPPCIKTVVTRRRKALHRVLKAGRRVGGGGGGEEVCILAERNIIFKAIILALTRPVGLPVDLEANYGR